MTSADLARATFSVGNVMIRGPRKRGRPLGSGKKSGVQLRLDKDILAHYRATGRGWQTRINEALRATLGRKAMAKSTKQ